MPLSLDKVNVDLPKVLDFWKERDSPPLPRFLKPYRLAPLWGAGRLG
jgi:hypothetical protein